MAAQDDIARFTENLTTELDAAGLYARLAQAEPNPDLANVYRGLSETERRHAARWEARLREVGAPVPDYKPGWRTRTLGWLAGRFGASFVLPTVAGIEARNSAQFLGQAGPDAAAMAAESRSHARLFSNLATTTQGLEGSAVARFEGRHRATGGNALRAGVLGANDGLVSVFSLVMGVAGAGQSAQVIFLTGVAGLLAGALSMALGEWLSVQSSRELYQHQLDIEQHELAEIPEEEKAELALIYQAKGVAPETARELASRLLSDKTTALDTLAREELGIDPKELGGSAWEAALTSFLLFAVGAMVPVLPYLFFSGVTGIIVSALFSAFGLFLVGAAITLMTGRNPVLSGLRQVLFGMAAAAITFGVGHLIGVNVAG